MLWHEITKVKRFGGSFGKCRWQVTEYRIVDLKDFGKLACRIKNPADSKYENLLKIRGSP